MKAGKNKFFLLLPGTGFLQDTSQGLRNPAFHSSADIGYGCIFHDDIALWRYTKDMLPVHQVSAVGSYKAKRFQHGRKLLQHFGRDHFLSVAEINIGVVTAGFKADDLIRSEEVAPF